MQVRVARWRDRHLIRAWLLRDFPAEERVPTWFLYLMARRKLIDFLIFHKGETPIGFSYVIHTPAMAYLFYLAVDEAHRGKGYGSEILMQLEERYGPTPLTLNIECQDAHAANAEQRKRRKAFYVRNGFRSTGFMNRFPGGRFEILTNRVRFEPRDFQQLFRRFSWGFFSPKLDPLNSIDTSAMD